MSDVSKLLEIMTRLRDPRGGCPWDLEQDFASIAPYTIEEAYEVDDAIRRGDLPGLREELGDLLLQVVFHAQMAREAGHFTFGDVVEAISGKLIERHPHVFGDSRVESSEAQTEVWERMKSEERARRGASSAADGVPLGLPALLRARKLVSRAERAGLLRSADSVEALERDLGALRAALASRDAEAQHGALGELLFAAAALAQGAGIDPEQALRDRVARFEAELRASEPKR